MRNPDRIDIVLRLLEKAWKSHPDLRLGQLILNVVNSRVAVVLNEFPDEVRSLLYNLEDKDIFELLADVYLPNQDVSAETTQLTAMAKASGGFKLFKVE